MLIGYVAVIVAAIIVGLLLKLPILPDKPMRNSWMISIIFPTVILAVGFFAIFNYFKVYNNIYTAIIIGIFSAVFSKFFLERVFPKPEIGEQA